MKFSYLAVVMPMKWLPQNTEQARTQAWAAVSQLLLTNLGKFYGRFYPAVAPWGQAASFPFSVVFGREDPAAFLNLFYHAKNKLEKAVAFHSVGMLNNIKPEQMQEIGDTLICHVMTDGSNEALTVHALWYTAVMAGVLMPDCGLYFLEQKQSVVPPEVEREITAHPSDYVLCAVTLEENGVRT